MYIEKLEENMIDIEDTLSALRMNNNIFIDHINNDYTSEAFVYSNRQLITATIALNSANRAYLIKLQETIQELNKQMDELRQDNIRLATALKEE